MPRLILTLPLVIALTLAGADGINAATPAQVVKANRQAAVRAADQLLGELILPAGAVEVSSEPAGDAHQLARSFVLSSFAAQADRHEFWTTSASPSDVIASIQTHLPAGARIAGSGTSDAAVFVSYVLPAVGAPTLGPWTLAIDAVQLRDDRTGVRADAIVRYFAPRLPTLRIPSQARVLDIAMANPGAKPLLSLTVTRRAQVRRIAAMVDRLPFAAALGVAIPCPARFPAPIDTFTFRAAPAGAVLAQVSEPANTPASADVCATAMFTIRGHREHALLEGGALLRDAGALLGAKLTTRL